MKGINRIWISPGFNRIELDPTKQEWKREVREKKLKRILNMENEYNFWLDCVIEWENKNGDIDGDKEIEVILFSIKKAYEKGKNGKNIL